MKLSIYNPVLKKLIEYPLVGAYIREDQDLIVIVETFIPTFHYRRVQLINHVALSLEQLGDESIDVFNQANIDAEFLDRGLKSKKISDKELEKRIKNKCFIDSGYPRVINGESIELVNRMRIKSIDGEQILYQPEKLEHVMFDTQLIVIDSKYCVLGTEEFFTNRCDFMGKLLWEGDIVTLPGKNEYYIIRYIPAKNNFYLVTKESELYCPLEKALAYNLMYAGNVWTEFYLLN